MAQGYKDHPIPQLKGDVQNGGRMLCPTQEQYEDWWNQTSKSLSVIGHQFIGPMALGLTFEKGAYVPIAPVLAAGKTMETILCSSTLGQPGNCQQCQNVILKKLDPLIYDDPCSKNYYYLVQAIAGFSSQLYSSCLEAFP
eukprot:3936020-Rhodomonas_salina.4